MSQYRDLSYQLFDHDDDILAWAKHAAPIADKRRTDPDLIAKWLRCDGTWFVGADVLGNMAHGGNRAGPAFAGAPVDFCKTLMPDPEFDWGPGQVSTMYPRYPRQDVGESAAAHAFRRNRDAAHLDGLKPVDGRRFMEEYHGFILGIPLNTVPRSASPFVVWEGSHLRIADMLTRALGDLDPSDWPNVDLTNIYQHPRREIFECCNRVEVCVPVGQSYVAHRFAIHGVAPWAGGDVDHRTIAYFRPFWKEDMRDWLTG